MSSELQWWDTNTQFKQEWRWGGPHQITLHHIITLIHANLELQTCAKMINYCIFYSYYWAQSWHWNTHLTQGKYWLDLAWTFLSAFHNYHLYLKSSSLKYIYLCKSKWKHKKISLYFKRSLRPRQENLYKRVAKVNNGGMTKHIKRDQQMRNLKCHA